MVTRDHPECMLSATFNNVEAFMAMSPRRTALVFVVLSIVGGLVAITHGANPSLPVTFVENGPAGFHTPAANGVRAGAINAMVVHPTNADIVWIGGVNGGVWKTTNATSASPTWTPLTDHQPSLSIGSLALDPTFPNADVLVAGIGHASSFGGRGGPLAGVLRTTDGGSSWTQLGAVELSKQKISGIAARGPVIVATSQTGVWRSTTTGNHFDHLGAGAGLGGGPATDLEEDPVTVTRLYVGITGPSGGVFRSDTTGESWANRSGSDFGGEAGADLVTDANKIVIAVHANANLGTSAVYVGVMGPDGNPSGVFRSPDQGATWKKLDIPSIEVAAQGRLSIAADPEFSNYVYLGGDESPGGKGEGPIYRCDSTLPPGTQCTRIVVDGTLSNTAPHPDSRRMRFDAQGSLLETDDGGIFRRTQPRTAFGDWTSINGNLAITEPHSCAYDHIARVILCGTQDNGVVQQSTTGAAVWDQIEPFDGGLVSVTEGAGLSTRYYSSKKLEQFSRASCDAANNCSVAQPALNITGQGVKLDDTVDPGVKAYTPMASHAVDSSRLVIAADFVYESTDGGENLVRLNGLTGTATRAIAYGSAGNPDILYVGSSDGLFSRTTSAGPLVPLPGYTFDEPLDIALDPADWRSAWVVTAASVLHTSNAGATWTDVTADLGSGAGAADFNTVAFIPAAQASIIAIGASDGLYATDTAQAGHWYKLEGSLPNAVVYDLEYDATDDVLLVTTLGRGTWTALNAGSIHLPAPTTLTYTGDAAADYHDIAHLSALLSDAAHNQPISGKTIVFTLGSQSCSGLTDAAGARCQITLNQDPGSSTVTARFDGDVSHAPSSTSSPFRITREETTIHYTGDTLIAQGLTAHMAGVLREDDIAPISGATVTFTLGSGPNAQTCPASTDLTGTANCDISPVDQPLGPGTVRAQFAGNVRYLGSSDQASTLVFAFLTSGSFVVGDQSGAIGNAVSFWGAQWSKTNVLSGGGAPPAFKGFASSLSVSPPACGAAWNTSPGNSSEPPATVPSYMAAIASSTIAKAGSAIAGDTGAIVIVKTDAGYKSDPGHAGNGTVLAILCHQ